MKPTHFLPFLFLFLASPLTLAAETPAEPIPDGFNLWSMLMQGGWAMYPLALASLVMFFLIFYGYRETARKKFIPDPALPQLSEYMRERDIRAASHLLQSQTTVLSRSFDSAMARAQPDRPDANKTRIEASLAEALEHEENLVGQWINYLNVVATVSPMIGLLGTVSGMIGAFQTISRGGMGRPELLAGDIGQALVTTATGLVIGIPAMIAYFVLRNRLDNMMLAVGQTASLLVDQLVGEIAAPAPDEAPDPAMEYVRQE